MQIDTYIKEINPSNLVYISFDGVAPFAKLKQQKERRFKSKVITELINDIIGENDIIGNVIGNVIGNFDRTCITPGTEFMNELNSNSQVFYVCPFIDQSSKIEVSSVTQEFDRLQKSKLSKYKIALLHGRMKIDEKQKIMNMLRNGEIDILVSTPIIEVGVDISNATLIVINSADRFGISQLHQLRGRVGRGEKQSSCIIVSSDEINEITSKRLTALLKSNNGFTLAEEDLKIRGPGEVDQTKQSGWPEFKVANPLDFNLIEKVNKESERILSVDPELLDQKNEIIKNLLKNITSSDISLG